LLIFVLQQAYHSHAPERFSRAERIGHEPGWNHDVDPRESGALVIIVTGASSALGRPLLESLADVDTVVGTYNRNKPELAPSSSIQLYQVDVADEESVRRFADALGQTAKRITLVNLAGISSSRLAVELDLAEWNRVVGVSLTGSFLMSQAFLRPMIRERWGRIINISSVVAEEGVIGTTAYAAAKAGLDGLTRTLAKEYARYGILVNTLALGYFDGGMTQTLPEEKRKATLAKIPLRRFGEASELAEAIRYLMRASYVTGTKLRIDGGLP
jgi:3-oxoacyl-[acyl-carrier protein] reductase